MADGDDDKVRAAIDVVQDRLDWQEAEIARLGDVIREQDRRAGSTTARFGIKYVTTGPTFIVTCPSGDERAIVRAMFAGLASMAWTGFQLACENVGGDVKTGAGILFGAGDDTAEKAEG